MIYRARYIFREGSPVQGDPTRDLASLTEFVWSAARHTSLDRVIMDASDNNGRTWHPWDVITHSLAIDVHGPLTTPDYPDRDDEDTDDLEAIARSVALPPDTLAALRDEMAKWRIRIDLGGA